MIINNRISLTALKSLKKGDKVEIRFVTTNYTKDSRTFTAILDEETPGVRVCNGCGIFLKGKAYKLKDKNYCYDCYKRRT